MAMEDLDPGALAADGDDVVEGVEPPTFAEQLEHLHAAGWPAEGS